MGTSELTLNNLPLLEEHYPGVSLPFSQGEYNLIADSSHHCVPSYSVLRAGWLLTALRSAGWVQPTCLKITLQRGYQPALLGYGESEHIPDDPCGAPAFGW